jgi:4-aminobutyrate aminotransferase/(S)-3-amino-2-methylpropionate transaminase
MGEEAVTNAELSSLRAQVVPRGVPSTAPVYIAKARNATITDVEGRDYIDFAAGIGVMTVGHCHLTRASDCSAMSRICAWHRS